MRNALPGVPQILVYQNSDDTVAMTIPHWGPRSYARASRIAADVVEQIAGIHSYWPTARIERGATGATTFVEWRVLPGTPHAVQDYLVAVRLAAQREAQVQTPRHPTGITTHEVVVL